MVEKVWSALERKWCLAVLLKLAREEPCRFSELHSSLSGISTKTLSSRLKELKRLDLVAKRGYDGSRPRVGYVLTEEGEELASVVCTLDEKVRQLTEKGGGGGAEVTA